MKHTSKETKVALVTGSARRIGAEIARTLHAAGMNVLLHYHASEKEALKLSDELNLKRDDSAHPIKAELGTPDAEKTLILQSIAKWGQLDVLVNNASRYYGTPFNEVTGHAWDDLLNSNLKSPFFLAQAAAPYLAGVKGTIINIIDVHADIPMRDYGVYCISKGGLATLTKVLAKELAPNIRVNGVSPGAVLWPEGENALSDETKQKIISKTSLKRLGNPIDIAKAVLFLISDADYINGQVLNIDGGRLSF